MNPASVLTFMALIQDSGAEHVYAVPLFINSPLMVFYKSFNLVIYPPPFLYYNFVTCKLINVREVYILDYDTDIAFVLNEWLHINGFKPQSFSSLEQLLQGIRTKQPDCIILDCMYGKMTLVPGICRIIQETLNYTGRIILTSTTAVSDNDLQVCNASAFMAKPFDLHHMVNMLNEQSDDFDNRRVA